MQRLRRLDASVGVGLAQAETLLARGGGRLDHDFRDRASRTRRHHHDAIGQINALEHRMRDENDGRPERRSERRQVVVELEAGNLVEGGEGLVHQHHRRPRHQGAGDRHPHLHAPGKLARISLGEAGEPNLLQRLFDARPRLFLRDAREAQRQPNVGEHVGPGGQRGLLKHEPEFRAVGAPNNLAPGRRGETRQQPQDRGLAAAGRP